MILMRPKSKRYLNKVNRILVKDKKDKSPIANTLHSSIKNNKIILMETNKIKSKVKAIKEKKVSNDKKPNNKSKAPTPDRKLFKVKKQKLSEEEIQIKENDDNKNSEVINTHIEIEKEEDTKQEIIHELPLNKDESEDSINNNSHQLHVNINEESKESKESSWTEEELNFLMPFEIKKLIESSSKSKEMILESITFPPEKNAVKILQHLKEISISSIEEIQNWFQRMIGTDRKIQDYDYKSNHWVAKKNFNQTKFSYAKPWTRYNSSPYSKDKDMRIHKSNENHKYLNYLKYSHNPELIQNHNEYSSKGEIENLNIENGKSRKHWNKSSRDEIIEYNPEEMSEECSDSNSNKSNQYMILNQDYQYNYPIMNKDLMITGKKIPIYCWK